MDIISQLADSVQNGKIKLVKEQVEQALAQAISPAVILNDGMIAAMTVVGTKFKNNEIYVPEMLIAARAMGEGLKVLEPVLIASGVKPVGKAVIGTVKGDLHDIGKNLVRMMMQGAGIEMHDIGIDTPAADFLAKAQEVQADFVCLSALLTTTMAEMEAVIKEFQQAGVRKDFVFMIGGAPVTEDFAQKIGADFYAPDAVHAADVARDVLHKKYA
ncbi:corrinoid protein [Acetonema longum]|uniref:Cobalamin B12-binding domain-containing protein n=1 Tax=Acetonema longum DSM 6540 TaxID=1009370 RepID=F7NLS3_9FIRM|nr:corrinoid protein [Acetonema longum]EGO63014.1 cobalamin B12-binding domain-containing protein [Acetonema longum DSM 6540]